MLIKGLSNFAAGLEKRLYHRKSSIGHELFKRLPFKNPFSLNANKEKLV